jgi:hypothetical protein
MSPRARRSESITLPAGNHPVLVRYTDEKNLMISSEKHIDVDSDEDYDEDDSDTSSNTSYDSNDSILAKHSSNGGHP